MTAIEPPHPTGIRPDVRDWLLDPIFPSVRRLASRRLGLVAEGGGSALLSSTVEEPWIASLLVERTRRAADGTNRPVHPYVKWRGAHWRLVALAELDADPDEPAVARAVGAEFDRIVAWVSGRSRTQPRRRIHGRMRQCASQDGNAAWAAIRLGLGGDPRVGAIIERLLDWQWPAGGGNCDKRPAVTHPSLHESLAPLRALAAYARSGSDPSLARSAAEGAARTAAFLLDHRVDRSHRTGAIVFPAVVRLRWPAYWHYDRLGGLRGLREAGRLDDPRVADALASLRAAADASGRWWPDGRYWAQPEREGPNVEALDWTREGEARMLTLLALEVLGAAA